MVKRKVFVYTADKKIRGVLIKENERGYLARGYKVNKDGKKVPSVEFCDKRKSMLLVHNNDTAGLTIDNRIDQSNISPFFLKDTYRLTEYYNKLKRLLPCEVYMVPDDKNFYSEYKVGQPKSIFGVGVSDPKFYPIVVGSAIPVLSFSSSRSRMLKMQHIDTGLYYCPYLPLSV